MGLDSVELILEVEKYFSISIPDREAEKAYTVGDLVNVVAQILKITDYDFSLRESVFSFIKSELKRLRPSLSDFSLNDFVLDTIDINNKSENLELERLLSLRLAGVDTAFKPNPNAWDKLKSWFDNVEDVSFEKLRWKRYIDIMIAVNHEKFLAKNPHLSKYEIYLAIMKLAVDKIGVSYNEIGIEKSFTSDLGID